MTESPASVEEQKSCRSPLLEGDLLAGCVHCGFCLEVCPTYALTGDENNSPRGRLRLWRHEAEGRLPPDDWTDYYTAECVGCLACEPACPANVPYGEILEHVRREQTAANRQRPGMLIRLASGLAARPRLFNWAMLPARLLRRLGAVRHRLAFAGSPSAIQSTASYARKLMRRHEPNGPRVALLVGCLMESVFREINFATVRVLIENNIRVVVPENQTCCGALHEHTGGSGVEQLRDQNRAAFDALDVDAVVANSSGCGLALEKTLAGATCVESSGALSIDASDPREPSNASRAVGRSVTVRDVLEFLGEIGPVARSPATAGTRVYVDLPCHLIHGRRIAGIPTSVLDATGLAWELAPRARDCCGSGGAYNLEKPENAREILRGKAQFLDAAEGDPVVLATSNHVCMMQWHSALADRLVNRDFQVRHVIQLLDPGEDFSIATPARRASKGQQLYRSSSAKPR
ncbi:MAG: (Fe-S)-binding protein [Pirellulaceae bacterium]|nr:(Fe-S)-binding protein [Pirellulaceae bacterium]